MGSPVQSMASLVAAPISTRTRQQEATELNRTQVPAIFRSRTARFIAATLVICTTLFSVTHIVLSRRAHDGRPVQREPRRPHRRLSPRRSRLRIRCHRAALSREALHVAQDAGHLPHQVRRHRPHRQASQAGEQGPHALSGMLQAIDPVAPAPSTS